MRKRHARELRRLKQQIRTRFSFQDSETSDPQVRQFADMMLAFLESRHRVRCTCGEILDRLIDLGYTNRKKDFAVNVQEFTIAIEQLFSRRRSCPPAWSDALAIAIGLGWRQASPGSGLDA